MPKKRNRGRKRKALLPRLPSGRLRRSAERRTIERAQAEQSLNELKDVRARALGLSREQGDNPISETIAGRMALRGLLTRSQAEAIDLYAKLVRNAARAMQAPANTRCSLNLSRSGEVEDDPEGYAVTMRRYNDAYGELLLVSYRACCAINLVVRNFSPFPLSELQPARAGASALVKHFGLREDDAKADKVKAVAA